MQNDFWHERWQLGQIGFHLTKPHPLLERHWHNMLPAQSAGRVLVPLCGKSLDLVFLKERVKNVVGIECSPLAIQQFLEEQGLLARSWPLGQEIVHEASSYRLIEGDFFKVTAPLLGEIDAVYDRAALVAMSESSRSDYARQLRCLAGQAPILLITIDYDPLQMMGPPFPVPQRELEALFGENYRLTLLEETDALHESAALARRGLTALTESAWRLDPRSVLPESQDMI